MGRARLDSAFCSFLLYLLQLAVDTHGQTCSDPPINYEVQTAIFSPSTEVFLHCDISDPVWWASTRPCGPFTTSALCPNRTSTCSFNLTNIGNLFYHCCTAGDPVENSFGTNRDCVRVQICTAILEETLSHPPYTYFGERLLIYLQLYAYPPPNQVHQVLLTRAGSTQTSNVTEVTVSIFQPSNTEPLLSFEYSIFVPSVSENDVLFFSTEFQGCGRSSLETARIRIISREETTPVTSAATSAVPSTPQTSSVGPRNEDQCALNTGLMIGVIVLAVLTAALILLSVVIILYCMRLVRKHKRESSIALSSSNPALSSNNPGRPNTLTMADYSRLRSQDHTPSPAVTPYEVCPSNQQPRQNGSHLQRGHPGQATPLATPPSNLTQDSYRSHSGHTPLITLTPESHFSTARANIAVTTPPPPYGQMVEQNQSNVEYATVGSPRDTSPPEGGGGPIYNNTTISGLASNVELPGAETANQTIV